MPRGRAAQAEGVASDAAKSKNGMAEAQSQQEEAVGAQKIGQKRRGALQEVDLNRKTRRSSRGADSAGPAAKNCAPPSDRELRSKSRERAAGNSTNQSKKASSFKVFEDPVIVEATVGGSRARSGEVNKTSRSEKARAEESSSKIDDSLAIDKQETSRTSAGGWEVFQVDQGEGEQSDGKHASGSDKDMGESKAEQKLCKTEESADGQCAPGDDDVIPVDDQPDSGEENERAVKIEQASSSFHPKTTEGLVEAVDAALRTGKIGREIVDEDVVAVVAASLSPDARDQPIEAAVPSSSLGQFDLDSGDRMDEFCVTEYTDEIYAYLRVNETRSMVDPDYMSGQDDINAKMRVILMDWLIEVHLKFKLRQETIYLCFQLIDRFLEKNSVRRGKLQLVGVTGLMLASKYEEIYPPEVRDYVYICDNAYNRQDILDMEQTMLAKLGYRLSLPTVWSFMKRFCKAAGHQVNEPDVFFHLISYAIELAMIQIRMLRFKPSMLVAASIFLVNTLQEKSECWTEQLKHHTGYSETDLEDCVSELRSLIADAPREPKYKAVYKKFCHQQFERIAQLPCVQQLTEGEPAAEL